MSDCAAPPPGLCYVNGAHSRRINGKTGDLADLMGCVATDGSGDGSGDAGDLVDLITAKLNADFVDAVDSAHKIGITLIILGAFFMVVLCFGMLIGTISMPKQRTTAAAGLRFAVAVIIMGLGGGLVALLVAYWVYSMFFIAACESEHSSPAFRTHRRARLSDNACAAGRRQDQRPATSRLHVPRRHWRRQHVNVPRRQHAFRRAAEHQGSVRSQLLASGPRDSLTPPRRWHSGSS